MSERAEPPTGPRHRWGWLALLLALVLVAYSPALSAGFLNFDDDRLVVQNPLVAGGLTAEGLRRAFGESYMSNWVPLTWLSHMLDRELFGLAPAGHHAVSLLLHALNVALVYLFARSLLQSSWGGLGVALLFGLHPLHVESVAWVAERKDVLSTAFLLGTLLAWLAHARAPRAGRYALALSLLALGLMAKQMLVTVPVLLLLLDFWPLRRLERARLPRRVLETLPFFALAAAAGVVTVLSQSAGGAVQDVVKMPLWSRPANAAIAAVTYLVKALAPSGLAIFVPHPRADVSLPLAAACAALLAAISWLVWRERARRPYLVFGWLWYLVTLLPVIGLLQVGEQALAFRYIYVPMLGVYVAAVAFAGERLRARRVDPALARAAAALLALVLAGLTFGHARHWQDSERAWLYALEVTERNYVAHSNLAAHYAETGRALEALAQARRALEIEPGYVDAQVNVAAASAALGRFEETIAACQAVLARRPRDPRALQNLAAAYMAMGRMEEALAGFERLVAEHPTHLLGLRYAGRTSLELGRLDAAAAHFEAALALAPKDVPALFGLGLVRERQGREARAEELYREALALAPDFAPAREALAAIAARR